MMIIDLLKFDGGGVSYFSRDGESMVIDGYFGVF